MELELPNDGANQPAELTTGSPVLSKASPEPEQMRQLVGRLNELAAGKGGKFVLAGYGEDPTSGAKLVPQVVHILNEPGCVDKIMQHAAKLAETPGLNVYIEPVVVREGVPIGQRGKKQDVLATLAMVFDFDDADAANWKHRLPALEPHAVVETSPGRFQVWFFLETAASPEEVERLAKIIAENSGADACWSCDHLFRLPGLLNWANRSKQKKSGRGPEPVRSNLLFEQLWRLGHSVAAIAASIDAKWPGSGESKPTPKIIHDPNQPGHDFSEKDIEQILYREDIVDRSKQFFKFVQECKRRNFSVDETIALAIKCEDTYVMNRFGGDRARIEADIRRIWEKDPTVPDPTEQYSHFIAATEARLAETSQRKWSEADFIHSTKGFILANNQHNVFLALFLMKVELRYNLFQSRSLITRYGDPERYLDDPAMAGLWLTIDRQFGFRPGKDFFWTFIEDLARKKTFHPVLDYLNSLEWDGVSRLDKWLSTYGEAEDSPYVQAVSAIVLIAAVRRVRQPGCKFDEMLVLESKQGTEKSTAFKTLAGEDWFTDDLPLDADSKRVIENTAGRWIIEAAELKGMRLGDIEHLKSFLSRQVDRARLAYGRLTTEVPRQFVVVGTTNSSQYLRDSTGNRRFWPVKIKGFDIKALRRARDQIWAEAAFREAIGESIRLDPSLYNDAAKEQELRLADDPFVEVLQHCLGDRVGKISAHDIWNIIGVPQERRTQSDNARLGEAMRMLGWERDQARFNKKFGHGYFRGTKRERQQHELTVTGVGDRALVSERGTVGESPRLNIRADVDETPAGKPERSAER